MRRRLLYPVLPPRDGPDAHGDVFPARTFAAYYSVSMRAVAGDPQPELTPLQAAQLRLALDSTQRLLSAAALGDRERALLADEADVVTAPRPVAPGEA